MPNFVDSHSEQLKNIMDAITATIAASELHATQDRTIFRISLDDAVEVLKDLKVEDDEDATTTKRIGKMLGKRDYDEQNQQGYRGKYGRDKRHKTYIPNGKGHKAMSTCRSCNEPNHWYLDPECIFNVIKALMEGKEIETDTIQKLAPATRELFKDQKGNILNKIPVSKLVNSVGNSNSSHHAIHDSNAKASASYFQKKD